MTKFLLDTLIKAVLVACAFIPVVAPAQDFPSKPVGIIVPWPANLPPAVVEKLHGALRKAMSVEAVRERYRSMGVKLMDMSQPEFTAYVRSDYEKWRALAKEGNIVIE